MKKTVVILATIAMIFCSSISSIAGESQMRTTFQDAWYGGLAGALVGGAILIFREDPEDHLDYIAYGFGAGVIVGATYGITRSTKAIAEFEDGKFKVSLPTPKTTIVTAGNRKALQVRTDILRVNF